MRTFVVNAAVRSCCGLPRGECRCYDDPPPATNAAEPGDLLDDELGDLIDAELDGLLDDDEPDDLTDNAADDVLEVPTLLWARGADAEPVTNAADYADDILGVPDMYAIIVNAHRREAAERRERLDRRRHRTRAVADDFAANADPDILDLPQIDWGAGASPGYRGRTAG